MSSDDDKKIETAQGNAEDHAADLPRCVPQNPRQDYATRSETRFKIARNCWFHRVCGCTGKYIHLSTIADILAKLGGTRNESRS